MDQKVLPANALQMKLINGWQRDFPLTSRPFMQMADEVGLSEKEVLSTLSLLLRDGLLSRVGAVVRPNTAGASTLAAMKIPPVELERVAAIVSDEPGVNHNYEREHSYNLWFVATAGNRRGIEDLLGRVRRVSGYDVLDLRLKRAHHIDLGFAIGERGCLLRSDHAVSAQRGTYEVSQSDRNLLAAIENGLSLIPRPFEAISTTLGISEMEVIEDLTRLVNEDIISRFGLVVRHRKMGFTANAMAVWNVDDERANEIGERFAAQPFVTLCYQRQRAEPDWPYNLYCMIHGCEKATVLSQIGQLNEIIGPHSRAHSTLFSKRCFKQRGAHFSSKKKCAKSAGLASFHLGEVSHV